MVVENTTIPLKIYRQKNILPQVAIFSYFPFQFHFVSFIDTNSHDLQIYLKGPSSIMYPWFRPCRALGVFPEDSGPMLSEQYFYVC